MDNKIKNYTSKVPVNRTISQIETLLASIGAKRMVKDYEDKKVVSLSFVYEINGTDLAFQLPAKTESVYHVLSKGKKLNNTQRDKLQSQAERTAWRILLNWVEVQVAMIECDQLEFMQIFFTHLIDMGTGETFYQKLKSNNFKLIAPNHD